MEKQMKFMDLFYKLRTLVEISGKKCQPNKFNEYIDGLPRDKAKAMKEMRQYRNELAFPSHNKPLPGVHPKLDEWISLLEEEIRNLKNKKEGRN